MQTLSVEEQSHAYFFLEIIVWRGFLSNEVVQLYSLRFDLTFMLVFQTLDIQVVQKLFASLFGFIKLISPHTSASASAPIHVLIVLDCEHRGLWLSFLSCGSFWRTLFNDNLFISREARVNIVFPKQLLCAKWLNFLLSNIVCLSLYCDI